MDGSGALHADGWQKRHGARWARIRGEYARRESQAATPPGGLVFLGSSTIRHWYTLNADFAELRPCNRGFPAARATDLLPLYADMVACLRPRGLVLYCGVIEITNGTSIETTLADIRRLCLHALAHDGALKIAIVSLLPHPAYKRRFAGLAAVNAGLVDFARANKGISCVDAAGAMAALPNDTQAGLFGADNIHLTEDGYRFLTAAVLPAVQTF